MGGHLHIRQISNEDWDRILALESSAYADQGLSEQREVLESRAGVSPTTCFVLECGRTTAGYLLALPYPMFRYPDLNRIEQDVRRSTNLHLHDLVIAAGFRGRGLAKALLGHLTDIAAGTGYRQISLVAVGGSGKFWSANGFAAYYQIQPTASYGDEALYMSKTI